jgi:hypothetical protein
VGNRLPSSDARRVPVLGGASPLRLGDSGAAGKHRAEIKTISTVDGDGDGSIRKKPDERLFSQYVLIPRPSVLWLGRPRSLHGRVVARRLKCVGYGLGQRYRTARRPLGHEVA